MSGVPYSLNLLRSNYVTYMYPTRNTYNDIIYKNPEHNLNWSALLSCFTWQVYVCGLMTLVGVIGLFLILKWITAYLNRRNNLDGQKTIETIMSTIGVTCNQGITCRKMIFLFVQRICWISHYI